MALRFYNSLTRKKEEFKPIKEGRVGLYTCGPTVYDYAHIGNYRAYAFEDLLRRYLKYKGYEVKQVMNITDVDDKIIKGVNRTGLPREEYTHKYIKAFFNDLDTLNIERAEVYPKASETIDEMVKIIKILMDKGIAYRGEDGSIYYAISKFPDYGKLAHINPEELKAGARVKHDEYDKENVSDFALWKAYDEADGDIYWETELGRGRPGWHIECSAMSSKNLGRHFDIHTGGVDNLFPHHENEIAQSEGAFGGTFVNYWLHCDHLLVHGKKMAKSEGNFYKLQDVTEKGINPIALRYFYISSDYRKKLDFTFLHMDNASKALARIYEFLRRLTRCEGGDAENIEELIEEARKEFELAMDDDLNSSRAMGAIFTFISKVNKLIDEGKVTQPQAQQIINLMVSFDKVLGLEMEHGMVEKTLAEEVKLLIEQRAEARSKKDFKTADEIRDQLLEMGIELMDTEQGTRWKVMASIH